MPVAQMAAHVNQTAATAEGEWEGEGERRAGGGGSRRKRRHIRAFVLEATAGWARSVSRETPDCWPNLASRPPWQQSWPVARTSELAGGGLRGRDGNSFAHRRQGPVWNAPCVSSAFSWWRPNGPPSSAPRARLPRQRPL